MQTRTIKKAVNALAAQRRFILHMDCGHYVSLDERDLVMWPRGAVEQLRAGNLFSCSSCADLPPEPEKEMDPLEAFHIASFGGHDA